MDERRVEERLGRVEEEGSHKKARGKIAVVTTIGSGSDCG